MDKTGDSLFALSFIGLGVGGLLWANTNFAQMVRWLGMFSRWAYVVPTTRIGMSAAMLSTICVGICALPPRFLFYPEGWRSVFLVGFFAFAGFGLLHDLVNWSRGSGR
jgi:hypothetical protein